MRKLIILIALSVGFAGPAAAANLSRLNIVEESRAAGRAGWEGSLYDACEWMMSIDGQTGIDGLSPVDLDISFKKFIENLDFYPAGFGKIRRGHFGVAAGLFISDVGDGTSIVEDTDPKVKTSGELVIATLMDKSRNWEQRDSHVDLMAGARLWYLKDEIETFAGSDDLGLDGKGRTWVDPIVGAKVRLECRCVPLFIGWSCIGGLGALSKIDWDLFSGAAYEFCENMSALAGFPAVGGDYEGEELLFYVVRRRGPMTGTGFEL